MFKDNRVKQKIDSAYSKYNSSTEAASIVAALTAIPEVMTLINLSLIFDIVSTIGYKMENIFTDHFGKGKAVDTVGQWLSL